VRHTSASYQDSYDTWSIFLPKLSILPLTAALQLGSSKAQLANTKTLKLCVLVQSTPAFCTESKI
jgi:hypothetical protein